MRAFIVCMKAGLSILLFLSLAASPAMAQELSYDTSSSSASNTNDIFSEPLRSLELAEGMPTLASAEEPILNDNLRLGGPIVTSLKGQGIFKWPGRLLQLISPFSKTAAADQPLRVGRDAMAWSTVVGWHPGQSAFADDTHHEPQLRLITIRK